MATKSVTMTQKHHRSVSTHNNNTATFITQRMKHIPGTPLGGRNWMALLSAPNPLMKRASAKLMLSMGAGYTVGNCSAVAAVAPPVFRFMPANALACAEALGTYVRGIESNANATGAAAPVALPLPPLLLVAGSVEASGFCKPNGEVGSVDSSPFEAEEGEVWW